MRGGCPDPGPPPNPEDDAPAPSPLGTGVGYCVPRNSSGIDPNHIDGAPAPSPLGTGVGCQPVACPHNVPKNPDGPGREHAAGNMTSDGVNSYTCDAEGNVTQVKLNGSVTDTYTYDALNRRVRVDTGGTSEEFIYNPEGQHTSSWDAINQYEWAGWFYWGAEELGYYGCQIDYFEQHDWDGTVRVLTDINGNPTTSFQSLPFGDGFSGGIPPCTQPSPNYATLDQDNSANDHARFREYSNMAGRWFSPDPYQGSYDPYNPQSFNRYAYVMNSPLSATDFSGLVMCNNPSCESGNPFLNYGFDNLGLSLLENTAFTLTEYDFASFGPNFNWADFSLDQLLNFEREGEIELLNVSQFDFGFGGPPPSASRGASGGAASGTAPNNVASLTLLPSAPWAHQINKLMCAAAYKACTLGVGLANLECNIEKRLPASQIAPVSPIVCGDLTKQLELAECSRQLDHCMSNSGGDGDDKVLPNL